MIIKRVTKNELIKHVSQHTYVSQAVARCVINEFMAVIIEELARNHRVELRRFGTFTPRTSQARLINTTTGKSVRISARKLAKFHDGSDMRRRLNQDRDR
ncbi:HU family DNA-binding protein [Furfurilactobacillus curtus]|uniref:DNA-binding protein HU n=1 Tax=Furfurilactobacillus curtus TaxID=1746200 RepID=A0ABQ5JMC7_9LACO